jgi:hypothetical protein
LTVPPAVHSSSRPDRARRVSFGKTSSSLPSAPTSGTYGAEPPAPFSLVSRHLPSPSSSHGHQQREPFPMEPAPLPSVFFHPQQQEWPHAWRPSSPWLDARSTFFLPLSSPHLRLASQPPGSPPSFVSASSCPTVDVVRFLDALAVHARLAVHQCAVVWLGCPTQPTQRVGRRSSPGAAAWSAYLHGAQPARPAACSQPSVAAGVARLRGPGSASSRARLAIRRRRKVRIPRLPLR